MPVSMGEVKRQRNRLPSHCLGIPYLHRKRDVWGGSDYCLRALNFRHRWAQIFFFLFLRSLCFCSFLVWITFFALRLPVEYFVLPAWKMISGVPWNMTWRGARRESNRRRPIGTLCWTFPGHLFSWVDCWERGGGNCEVGIVNNTARSASKVRYGVWSPLLNINLLVTGCNLRQ